MKKIICYIFLVCAFKTKAQIISSYNVVSPTCNGFSNGGVTNVITNYAGAPIPISLSLLSSNGVIFPVNTLSTPAGTYSIIAVDNNFPVPITETLAVTISQPTLININYTITNNNCISLDGYMTPSGGTQPYLMSIDGVNYSNSPAFQFTKLHLPGYLTFYLKDANNCYVDIGIVHAEIGYPNVSIGTKVDVSVMGANDGKLLNIPYIDITNNNGKINCYIQEKWGNFNLLYPLLDVANNVYNISGLKPGNYAMLQAYAGGGCEKSTNFTINEGAIPNGLNINNVTNTISAYPNPTKGDFKCTLANTNCKMIELYSLVGQLLHTTAVLPNQLTYNISIPNLPIGVYTLRAGSAQLSISRIE